MGAALFLMTCSSMSLITGFMAHLHPMDLNSTRLGRAAKELGEKSMHLKLECLGHSSAWATYSKECQVTSGTVTTTSSTQTVARSLARSKLVVLHAKCKPK